MERVIENHYRNVFTGMAARASNEDSAKIKSESRKGDCYTYVSKVIKQFNNEQKVQEGRIRVYDRGGHPAHCVLLDKDKNIIADRFSHINVSHDKETGTALYKTKEGKETELKMGRSSFEMDVSDFSKLVENIDMLIDAKKTEDPEFNFMHIMNRDNVTVSQAIDQIKMKNELSLNLSMISDNKAVNSGETNLKNRRKSRNT